MASFNFENVNQRDELNRTLLHINVFENRLDVVKKLLQNGADASLTSNKGNTPLHTAASKKYHRALEVLLKYSPRDKLKKVVDAKTTVSGSTALHVASSNGCIECVRHLLAYGANFEVKNKDGKRPVDVAGSQRVKKLLADVEFDWQLAVKGNYAVLRTRMFDYSKADFLASVNARNNAGMTSLQTAVVQNHCNTVYVITEARVDRTQTDHALTGAGSIEEFFEHSKKVAERNTLLQIHAEDINVIGGEGMVDEIAVMLLAAHNIVKIAEKVFEPMDRPGSGEPYEQPTLLAVVEETLEALQFKPEHVALGKAGKIVFSGRKARYYKRLRIYRGNDEDYDDFKDEPKIVSYMGILQVTITRAIAMFMRGIYGVRMSAAAEENDLTMFERCVGEFMVDVNIFGPDRRTPLHHAADNGNEKMVTRLLIKRAAVTHQTESNQETALHLATKKGHLHIVRLLLQYVRDEKLKVFVDMKTYEEGWTALHVAAKAGRLDLIKCLLAHRATYDAKDKSGKTPAALSDNMLVTGFLAGIAELFEMAKTGNESLVRKLKALQDDELLAVGYARNSKGQTLGKVAEANGHPAVAAQVLKMVEKATPPPWEIPEDEDARMLEIESYRFSQTLISSPR